jgi:predicted transglutaminase-like cysteine proteinase
MEQTLPRRRALIAVALGLLAAAAPCQAQSFGLPSAEKNAAIIGGPSQLAAIMAAQSTGAAFAVPAAYPATFAVRRPVFYAAPMPRVTFDASPTRPDIFNSVAMPIASTALDARWKRVGTASVGGRAGSFAAALRSHDERSRLDAVNAYVNGHVTFTNDSRQFGVADRWSSANETLARGRGDCEDYALAKLAMLRRAGFADRDLYFVVLKDVARRADHAVLVVRSAGRFLVLDNGTNRLFDSAQLSDYRPVVTFTAGQRFTHGYRRSLTPPVVLASYDPQGPARVYRAGMPSSPFASR